jgi:hypothetical protein
MSVRGMGVNVSASMIPEDAIDALWIVVLPVENPILATGILTPSPRTDFPIGSFWML